MIEGNTPISPPSLRRENRADAFVGVRILGIAFLLLSFVVWQFRHLTDAAQGTDEGVYLASAHNLAAGHTAYHQVFLPKPPLFAVFLQGMGMIAGWHLAWYRLAMVGCTVMVILVAAVLAWWWRGASEAIATTFLLVLTPKMVYYARLFNADMPMFAAASGALLAAAYAQRRSRWWAWALAGAGIAAATGLKQNGILVAAPVLVFACWPREQKSHRVARIQSALRIAGWLVLGFCVAVAAMLPWLRQPGVLHEVLGQPFAARQTYPLVVGDNLRKIASFIWLDRGLLALTVVGVAISVQRRMHPIPAALAVWMLANALFLAMQAPLFSHHIPILFLPLGVFAGVGAVWLLAQLRAMVAFPHSAGRAPVGLWLRASVSAAMLAGTMLLVPYLLTINIRSTGGIGQGTTPGLSQVLRAYVPRNAIIVTDDPFAAFLAHLDVPPWFVDTSNVRLDSGYLTANQAIAQTEVDEPGAIVFATDHLDHLPAYVAWVRTNYDEVWSDGSTAVFIDPTPARAPLRP